MKRRLRAAAAAILVSVTVALSACTSPAPIVPKQSTDATAISEAFKSRGMMDHLKALQDIAGANGGNRASGSSGYEESARYVEEQLRAAGYKPVRQSFTYRDRRSDGQIESFNVLADSVGSAEHTIVVGGHLDSVRNGPGINDNGSGVAAILETALWMAESGTKPVNRVRFAFWGSEEVSLNGSRHYVDELSASEIDQTELNLNLDGVASANGVRFVHDGDGSTFGDGGPDGSKAIEDVFLKYFAENQLAAEATPFDGGSDYAPFLKAGIPAGGLFTGDVGTKTQAQVKSFGGVSGADHDPCYHKSCDTTENVDPELLKEMTGALAYATVAFAMGTPSG